MTSLLNKPDVLIAAVDREVRLRKKHYPRWVRSGKLTVSEADHEIECMMAVALILQAIKNKGLWP